jgi:hypothetical protein
MEIITIESHVFKDLQAKISTIAKFVTAIQSKAEEQPEDSWVDSYEVCTFLKISSKTLQRLRAANVITFSRIRGKNFYRISEIQRMLNENIIRRKEKEMHAYLGEKPKEGKEKRKEVELSGVAKTVFANTRFCTYVNLCEQIQTILDVK